MYRRDAPTGSWEVLERGRCVNNLVLGISVIVTVVQVLGKYMSYSLNS